MNLNSQLNGENWSPCKPGLIQSSANASKAASDQQHLSARRALLRKLSIGAVVVAGAGITGWSLLSNRDNENGNGVFGNTSLGSPAPIACSEVGTYLVSYVGKAIQDEQLLQRIQFHLTKCRPCADKHDKLACGLNASVPTAISQSDQL